ncbi:MAG: TetR/AcrR family transcriptional regulator [Desulfobacula sp.]|nr:TetR/AcrR family transcriptional regulator [Desulfobacula sp.]
MAAKGLQTKEKIIENALHLFSVKGYYNTSINDILLATNLTKGGLYGHFQSKEEVWYAAYDQAVAIWKGIVFKGVSQIKDPLERIETALDNDLRNYLGADVFEGGCFFLNMLVELSGQSHEMNTCVLDGVMGFSKAILRWLYEADEKQILKPGLDLEQIAKFIVTSINGCAALYASTRNAQTWEITLDQIHYYINSLRK